MAVANTKSTIVTNLDASPPVVNDVRLMGGRVREQVATVEVAAADDDGSVFRLFRVHSSWRVASIELLNDAITVGTVYDLGIYDIAGAGGAVVVQEAYGSDIDMSSARVAPLNATYEAKNIDKAEKMVWQDAGLSADPKKFYDIALTASTVGTAAGTITGILRYVAGD